MNNTFKILAVTLSCATAAFAQEIVVGTAQPATGVITEYGADTNRLIIRSESAAPQTYTVTKKTVFVDADGRTVTASAVRHGEPATVYYEKTGDTMVVSRVVVGKPIAARKTTTTVVEQPVVPPAKVIEKTTTTTTTETH
jgi:hypothetical protein